MSEHLAAAKASIRTAMAALDARLAEIQIEIVDLTAARRALLIALNGEGSVSHDSPLEVSDATPVARTAPAMMSASHAGSPAPRRQIATLGPEPNRQTAQVRVAAAVRAEFTSVRDIRASVTGLSTGVIYKALQHLVTEGVVETNGQTTTARRYRLSNATGAPPADSEGDRGARHARVRR